MIVPLVLFSCLQKPRETLTMDDIAPCAAGESTRLLDATDGLSTSCVVADSVLVGSSGVTKAAYPIAEYTTLVGVATAASRSRVEYLFESQGCDPGNRCYLLVSVESDLSIAGYEFHGKGFWQPRPGMLFNGQLNEEAVFLGPAPTSNGGGASIGMAGTSMVGVLAYGGVVTWWVEGGLSRSTPGRFLSLAQGEGDSALLVIATPLAVGLPVDGPERVVVMRVGIDGTLIGVVETPIVGIVHSALVSERGGQIIALSEVSGAIPDFSADDVVWTGDESEVLLSVLGEDWAKTRSVVTSRTPGSSGLPLRRFSYDLLVVDTDVCLSYAELGGGEGTFQCISGLLRRTPHAGNEI